MRLALGRHFPRHCVRARRVPFLTLERPRTRTTWRGLHSGPKCEVLLLDFTLVPKESALGPGEKTESQLQSTTLKWTT